MPQSARFALLARARSVIRSLVYRAKLERNIREEFKHHIAEREDHLVRLGHSREEAHRLARQQFGHQETHRTHAREALGLTSFAQFRFSWLDVKLGLRMLPKHPMLNLAAIFALAVGFPVGLAPSHLARALIAPLPGDTGGRVKAIRHWDPLSSTVAPTWNADFTLWSQSLSSFSSIGAFRASNYNVSRSSEAGTSVAGAQVTASVFHMLGARPTQGRMLAATDFEPGAPDVVVIGHNLWSSMFAKDPNVVGKSIRIGSTLYTVVGVMPDAFSFPNNESLWLPLRVQGSSADTERLPVQVLGMLADGVTLQQAQTELSSLGPPVIAGSLAGNEAEERARLRAEVVPFGLLYLGLPAGGLTSLPEFRFVQALMFVLLLVACGNVAMLMFARTATRLRELAIRTALGASRARIVSQIFLEALVLAVIAAGVGVLTFSFIASRVNIAGLAGELALPYWLSLNLTRETTLSALIFAVLSATVAGALPAVVITGRAIAQHIHGAARVRFGKVTGTLLVADIAVSVAAVGLAFAVSRHATDLQAANRATGIPASEYLAVEFRLPDVPGVAGDVNQQRAQFASAQRELVAALEREPGVMRAAIADALPRMEHRSRQYQLDDADIATNAPLQWTRFTRVDVDYLDALGVPMLSGRGFQRTDVAGDRRVAIVNTAFVNGALGGQDPLGRRVRFRTSGSGDSEWYEIVGVIGALGVNMLNADRGEAVYVAAAPGTINPMQVALHASVPPATLIGRVREVANAVNPDLVMLNATLLSDVRQGDWYLVVGIAVGLLVLVGVLIALATSGLYAMLSLAVSERTREIGIRAALGAPRRTLLMTILRRSLVQVGLGAAIGLPLAARFVFDLTASPNGGGSVLQSTAIALGFSLAIVLLVGLGACLVPARRILGVDASEAMHAEA